MTNPTRPRSDIEKLKMLLPYWIRHNRQHMRDNEKWLKKAEAIGYQEIARQLRIVIELSEKANEHIAQARSLLERKIPLENRQQIVSNSDQIPTKKDVPTGNQAEFQLKQIGVIRTPYTDNAPYQPVVEDEGNFRIILDSQYTEGLHQLEKFIYIYILYFVHRVNQPVSLRVTPPWTPGSRVGVFASRSPVRPNRLGLSIVRIKRITGNEILTSGLDVFDGTPLLDIKPYIRHLDSKSDANYGWLEDLDDRDHLMLHIRGIPHDY